MKEEQKTRDRGSVEGSESVAVGANPLLAGMSNELCTPMHGILGMTDMLLDTELDSEQRGYAQAVRGNAEALLQIFNDCLDLSRIEAGRLELEHIDFDLSTTVESVADTVAAQAAKKGLNLTCSIEPGTPQTLQGDPGRLRQVLLNLAKNAVEYTEKGEVGIRVVPVAEEASHLIIRFAVSDTGIGIPWELVGRLFKSFPGREGEAIRKQGGAGLGLAIAKRLAELMGGQIGVESKEGSGSTFWFTAAFELPAPS